MTRFTAIMLTALWFFNIACNVSAVLCVDATGAVSVETAIKDKCICSDRVHTTNSNESNFEKADCRDIPFAVSALAQLQKRFIAADVPTPVLQYSMLPQFTTSSQSTFTSAFYQSYFDPLGSIVLTI